MIQEQVLSEDQIRCLTSSARKAVYLGLRSLGQGSAAEIGALIHRPPAGVHYHLTELMKVGLVMEAFRRPSARRPEIVFQPVAERVTLPKIADHPELQELTTKMVVSDMRSNIRQYEAAAREAAADHTLRGNLQLIRATSQLTAQDMATVKAMIEEVAEFVRTHRDASGTPIQWSSLVFPLV